MAWWAFLLNWEFVSLGVKIEILLGNYFPFLSKSENSKLNFEKSRM